MGYTRCLSFPTILGYVLVTYVYYTVIVLVIKPWMGILTANGLLNTLSYTLWYLMVLWSYSICIFTDPGGVPAKYIPDMEDSNPSIDHDDGGLDRKGAAGAGAGATGGGKETRFCQKCGCHKPPRSHHCRVCKRCVLRMDHHCIWINNCVGHRNYKAFVLFVLFDVLALLHGLALLITHAVSCVSSSSSLSPAQCGLTPPLDGGGSPDYTWLHPNPGTSAFLRVAYVLICLPMGGSLLVLLLWQLYLVALNRTTIEMASSQRHRRACRKCKSDEEEEGEPRVPVEGIDGLKSRHEKGHSHNHSHSHSHSHGRGPMGWLARLGLTSLSRRSLIAMFFSHYASIREQLLDPKLNGLNFHPYDLGIAENLHVIMGPNPLLWFCPTATGHLHSGLRFPKSQDYGKSHMDRGL